MSDGDKNSVRLDLEKYKKLGLFGGFALLFAVSVFYIANYFGWPIPLVRLHLEDTVIVKKAGGSQVGILVDGVFQVSSQTPTIFANDEAFASNSTPIPIGHVSKATGKDGAGQTRTNEIVAFAAQRPMLIRENVPWTQKYDDIELQFQPKPLPIPITVWVLHDKDKDNSILQERKGVVASVAQTNSTWKAEKTGLLIVVTNADFNNALPSKNPKATGYAKFSCGATPAAKVAKLKSNIGVVPGRLNVYIVDEVEVGTTFAKFHGQTCLVGSDVVVLGSMPQITLLNHELGHTLNLYHPPSSWMKSKDRKQENKQQNKLSVYNVMIPDSLSHKYFSEGQIFRAHVQKDSALNDVYTERGALGAANGYPLRVKCTSTSADYSCPRLDKRIWANGSFYPPN